MITLKSGRKIGEGQPPYLIAEVGSNWESLADCVLSIDLAKKAGADAVKFQYFAPGELHGIVNHNAKALLNVGEACSPHLSPAWLPDLKAKADAVGIDFLCTAFSPQGVKFVDKFVEMHKVSSAEMTHVRILERLRDIGKPVLLSTGASGMADIGKAILTLIPPGAKELPLVVLHCVSSYPATATSLYRISMLKEFGRPVGYSDHSTNYDDIPLAAVSMGACVLEKHFKCREMDTPDSPHALTFDQFRYMVKYLKREVATVGYSHEEGEMILKHNRRLKAIKDIKPGDVLEEGKNFGIYRSLHDDSRALSPFHVGKVHGNLAKRELKVGDGIGPGDF